MGIVYAITRPDMPELMKIVCTTQSLKDRMRSLNRTGTPVSFEGASAHDFCDTAGVEKALYSAFADHRVSGGRKFFEIHPDRIAVLLRQFGRKNALKPAGAKEAQSKDSPNAEMEAAGFAYRGVGKGRAP